jgi:hypothetical protein
VRSKLATRHIEAVPFIVLTLAILLALRIARLAGVPRSTRCIVCGALQLALFVAAGTYRLVRRPSRWRTHPLRGVVGGPLELASPTGALAIVEPGL